MNYPKVVGSLVRTCPYIPQVSEVRGDFGVVRTIQLCLYRHRTLEDLLGLGVVALNKRYSTWCELGNYFKARLEGAMLPDAKCRQKSYVVDQGYEYLAAALDCETI